ncbi:hypothetical protein EV424DRAFT_1547886 [Suillus variegatus]|nr:hypothetical protein EV424DRAFT_1547886 [Suillus variegatus]
MTHSGYRTKYTDLDNSFSRRRKRISSSEIIEDNLHLSSGAKVFDILEPGHDSLGMNCSNIGDYLDVALAHDRWKDSKTLTMPECRIENSRSLDMGFDRFPSQPVSDALDLGFPPLSNTNRSSIATPISELDMGFPPGHAFNTNDFAEPATGSPNFWANNRLAGGSDSPLDMGFNSPPVQHGHPDLDMGFHSPPVQHRDPGPETWVLIHLWFNMIIRTRGLPVLDPVDIPDQSVGLRSEETPLDMGFGTDPAHDLAHHSNIQPEETPLEMGFETLDPVHGLPYQSSMVSEPEPMGFVIQRAVGDLRLAIHWLEMERAHGTMSPEEALVSEEVLQATSELLLAFQLISIYRLST